MPPVLWTGRLSLPAKLMVNISSIFAWITGNARDTSAMKQRMKLAYEGTYSDHVTRYDLLGMTHFTKIATELLQGVDLAGKSVLDIGCGTGILSFLALAQGTAKVMCTDISRYMLDQCRRKAVSKGYGKEQIDFRQADAESLPFDANSFDAVLSGMMFGLVPNQERVLAEMLRVLKPSGIVAISTYGPEFYHEAIDAVIRTIPLRYGFGYRVEFWPRSEGTLRRMFAQAGYADIRTRRLTWQDVFQDGGKAYDFFATTSASWWLSKLPPHKIAEVSQKSRDYFERKNVTRITQDIVLTYGRKPEIVP